MVVCPLRTAGEARVCGPIAQSRLERTPDKREVVGSIPTRPTSTNLECGIRNADFGSTSHSAFRILHSETGRGCSSAGRAPALHAGGHRFESVHLHHLTGWVCKSLKLTGEGEYRAPLPLSFWLTAIAGRSLTNWIFIG